MSLKPWIRRHPYLGFLLWLLFTPFIFIFLAVCGFLEAIGFGEWLDLGLHIWRGSPKQEKEELDSRHYASNLEELDALYERNRREIFYD